MKTIQEKYFDNSEESHQEKTTGVHLALDYIARESEKLGLDLTARLAGAAAMAAIVEMSKLKQKPH